MKTPARTNLSTERGFSWGIALLLLTALFLNYLDRQTLSVLVRFLPTNMKMSNSTYANVSSIFMLAYALAMPLAGWYIDKTGARLGLGIAVSVWSLFEMLCGFANSVFSLGTLRFFLGIAEASALPSITKVAAEQAAPHARATLVGIAMLGIGMGSTLAPPLVAFLTEHFTWRWAFLATGTAGFIWTIVWLKSYRNAVVPSSAEVSHDGPESWISLVRHPDVIGLSVAHVFSTSAWWFFLFWIPPYLSQERGLDLHHIGIYGWIPYFFASIGSAIGGYASGMLVRRGRDPVQSRKLVMWGCAAIMPFSFFVVKVQSVAAVLTLLAVATFFCQAFFSNLFSLPADLFPHRKVASVVGINVMCNSLAAVLSIQLTGKIVDHFSYTPVFAVVSLLVPIGAICAQFLVRSKSASGQTIHEAPTAIRNS